MINWSAEQLKEALLKADAILRPIVIYVNPLDEQALIEALGDIKEIKERVVIKPCEIIVRGKAYAINRKSLNSFGGENLVDKEYNQGL